MQLARLRQLLLVLVAPALSCAGAADGSDAATDTDAAAADNAVFIGNPDSRVPPPVDVSAEQAGEAGTPDLFLPDTPDGSASPDVPTADTLDAASGDGPATDAAQDSGPDTSLPDATPDLAAQDVGTVDAGPCGQCPANLPSCVAGVCVCTGTSCTGGSYCKAGQCTPCAVDGHCGPDCTSCSAQGDYCASDGSKCVDCNDAHPCQPGVKCLDGTCVTCETLGLCGVDCLLCEGTTPVCAAGACACDATSCGKAFACEAGACVPCTGSDPVHCGADCLVCTGPTPHCKDAACTLCNQDASCGPSCSPCPGATPYCLPGGSACVACLDTAQCPANHSCVNNVCKPNCSAQGCAGDMSASGEKCSKAFIVGRLDASDTATFNGDTYDASDDDNLNYFFGHDDCWDASSDNFYRIYLVAGDSLSVNLAIPASPNFDAMLKLYTGTECDDDSAGFFSANDKYLIKCYDNGSDGDNESFSYTATADGWYTVVVDGRLSGIEEEDYGPYTLTLALTCANLGCCCP